MTDGERLRDLAQVVIDYDAVIQDVARRRGRPGGGAWSVDGPLGERLDRLYFALLEKARAALEAS